jgi:hypothetical protein
MILPPYRLCTSLFGASIFPLAMRLMACQPGLSPHPTECAKLTKFRMRFRSFIVWQRSVPLHTSFFLGA